MRPEQGRPEAGLGDQEAGTPEDLHHKICPVEGVIKILFFMHACMW